MFPPPPPPYPPPPPSFPPPPPSFPPPPLPPPSDPGHGQVPWHRNVAVLAVLLLCCWPVGLILVWMNPTWTAKTKAIVTSIVGVLALAVAFSPADISDEPSVGPARLAEIPTTEIRPNTTVATTTTAKPPTTTPKATTTTVKPTTTTPKPTTTTVKPTTTTPKPTTTTVYIAPTTIYIAPTTVYVAPTTEYVPPPTTEYVPPRTNPPDEGSGVYYPNCDAAKAAGAAPMSVGDPGYRPALDRDKDGTACDK